MDSLRKRWPRSCRDSPGLASYSRITESRAGTHWYATPTRISVLDVIKASEEAPGDAIHGKHWRHLESLPGYHQLHMVSQIVEDALRRVYDRGPQGTILHPHRQLRCSARLTLARRSVGGFLLTYTGGLVAVKSNLVSFETGQSATG